MAGDWIKIERATPTKPEVAMLAHKLNLTSDEIVGKLIRLWCWADEQSLDGNAIPVTYSFLDELFRCDGFCSALVDVGWLNGRDGLLSIPNFDRHNGKSAKQRGLTNKRVKKIRNDKNVTDALPEKRREEKEKVKKEKSSKARAANQAEVVEYVIDQGLPESDGVYLWNHWEASDWMRGKQPIRDWKATVRAWKTAGYLPSQKQQNAEPTHNQRGDYLKKQRQQMLEEMGAK